MIILLTYLGLTKYLVAVVVVVFDDDDDDDDDDDKVKVSKLCKVFVHL